MLGGGTDAGISTVKEEDKSLRHLNFFWTSTIITSGDVALQDGPWYLVLSADQAPVEKFIRGFARDSLLLTLLAIVLLIVVLTLGFYAYRRNALSRQQVEHLEQVARVREQYEKDLELEAARQEQERIKLENLLQSLDEGIVLLGPDGRIEFANAEYCRIFDLDNAKALIGKEVVELLEHSSQRVKESREFVGRIMENFKKKESINGDRIEFIDGAIIERSSMPIFDSQKYIGRLAVIRDVTTRERNEETIKRLQRTELLGRLAGGIAHDFNNVLGVITGSLQMMLKKVDDSRVVNENAQRALSSAKRGSEVAKRLLQFVRYSPTDFEDFSIRHIIEETESIINHTFEENFKVHVEYLIPDAIIHGSPGDMQQVILNLAHNSNDAMPHGGTFTISLETAGRKEIEAHFGKSAPSNYVVLKIKDSGAGIDADTLDRIFEPFFTTKDVGKGTGLGLSIVQTIISAHDGFVEVKSAHDSGTTFSIYLPRQDEQIVKPRETDHAQGSDDESSARKPVTVLIVEDEPDLRDILADFLVDKGMHVITAQDGEEGYNTFRNHPEISVVITDLGLPRISGDKLLTKIRADRPDIGCILATGYLTPFASGLSDPHIRLILKPYNLAAIYKNLIEIIP